MDYSDNFNYLYKMRETLVDTYVNNVRSDVSECYMVYRKYDNKIEVHKVDRLIFDREIFISYSNNGTISGTFEIPLNYDNDNIINCAELTTEYKQIKEYEDRIKQLESRLKNINDEKNKWWSKYLHSENKRNPYINLSDIMKDIAEGKWFAVFLDFYADSSNESSAIVVTLDKTDEFFGSDYWTNLFTKNEVITSANLYEPPNITHDNMGINHWFVVCDSKSYNSAVNHLKYYPDSHINIVKGTKEYMYNRLNDIWKITYGKEHKIKSKK